MTGHRAIAIISGLNLSQAESSRVLGVHVNTVSQWARGGPVSAGTSRLLRLLEIRPELVDVLREMD
jgi:DNA-binding transcriptional regulator YiaG